MESDKLDSEHGSIIYCLQMLVSSSVPTSLITECIKWGNTHAKHLAQSLEISRCSKNANSSSSFPPRTELSPIHTLFMLFFHLTPLHLLTDCSVFKVQIRHSHIYRIFSSLAKDSLFILPAPVHTSVVASVSLQLCTHLSFWWRRIP